MLQKSLSGLAIGVLLIASTASFAQNPPQLPDAMTGVWSIQSKVIKNDAPRYLYSPASSEIWRIEKIGPAASLENVATHAKSNLQITSADTQSAKATHGVNFSNNGSNYEITENLSLALKNGELTGENHQEIVIYKKRQSSKTYHLDIEIKGTRLNPLLFNK